MTDVSIEEKLEQFHVLTGNFNIAKYRQGDKDWKTQLKFAPYAQRAAEIMNELNQCFDYQSIYDNVIFMENYLNVKYNDKDLQSGIDGLRNDIGEVTKLGKEIYKQAKDDGIV